MGKKKTNLFLLIIIVQKRFCSQKEHNNNFEREKQLSVRKEMGRMALSLVDKSCLLQGKLLMQI